MSHTVTGPATLAAARRDVKQSAGAAFEIGSGAADEGDGRRGA